MPSSYPLALEAYAAHGVDTEAALRTLVQTPLSLHCWQGDDVRGFEKTAGDPGGGLAVTGSYPGRARTPDELRADLEQALRLLPGRHRVNLHASYAELGGANVDRDAFEPKHFQGWIDWAKARRLGLDFNPTYFGHPLAGNGLTLTHPDATVRQFWIAHGIVCRRIGAEMGRQLGSATITNVWIPDGSKDLPVDRRGPRERLAQSLDAIFTETIDPANGIDAVESKLFGIGSEAYVAGSHEFYLGYAITRQKHLCLDAGHFHPTESVADKISSVLQFVPGLLLHVSRGVRWDSDHVVILDDATRAIFQELVRGDFLGRTRVGLDFFDASINRVAAWVIGARSALKALLAALLEPAAQLRACEMESDFAGRLALMEEARTWPVGAVWEEYCRRQDVAGGTQWLEDVRRYEREVMSGRNR
jgi:L-rhamnose isomerase